MSERTTTENDTQEWTELPAPLRVTDRKSGTVLLEVWRTDRATRLELYNGQEGERKAALILRVEDDGAANLALVACGKAVQIISTGEGTTFGMSAIHAPGNEQPEAPVIFWADHRGGHVLLRGSEGERTELDAGGKGAVINLLGRGGEKVVASAGEQEATITCGNAAGALATAHAGRDAATVAVQGNRDAKIISLTAAPDGRAAAVATEPERKPAA